MRLLPYFPPRNKCRPLRAARCFSLSPSFSNQMRDFELKVICHTESTTDPVDFSKPVHVTPSGMILLLHAVLGCWGTVQCVGISGEKEMWSKKNQKIWSPCPRKPPGTGRANRKDPSFAASQLPASGMRAARPRAGRSACSLPYFTASTFLTLQVASGSVQQG